MQKVEGSSPFIRLSQEFTTIVSDLERYKPWLRYDSAERFYAESIEGTPDVIYGRVVEQGSDTWLQFWTWYTMNWAPLIGRHQGDWEGIQIQLDPEPVSAVYAQHARGQRASWDTIVKRDGRPVVYVANGSHASYVTPGWHRHTTVSVERANGNGRHVDPELVVMPEQGWPLRPGRWGADKHSPASPGHQWRWRQPSSWAAYV
jgi:hypothetical protein